MKNCETFNETRIIHSGKRGLRAILPEKFVEKLQIEKGDILGVSIQGNMYIVSPSDLIGKPLYRVGYYKTKTYYRLTITLNSDYTKDNRLKAGQRLNTEIVGDNLILTPQEAKRE
jgi:antitoxin component of MazEF toxin-antitoxin module